MLVTLKDIYDMFQPRWALLHVNSFSWENYRVSATKLVLLNVIFS
jgi:hypothetical protein